MRLVGLGAILLLCTTAAAAQHGRAMSGYFPPNYDGETFTGKVTAVEGDSITLTYSSKRKSENFTARASEPCDVPRSSGNKGMSLSEIPVGTQMTVYYEPSTHKVDGKKIKDYTVVAVSFIDFNGQHIPEQSRRTYYCVAGQSLQFRAFE